MKNEITNLRFICDAPPKVGRGAFGGLARLPLTYFVKAFNMSTKEISHFVRNDGVSPSDGGWKSGGWSLSEVEVAATFPPTDDTRGVSIRPKGDLDDIAKLNLIIPEYFILKYLKSFWGNKKISIKSINHQLYHSTIKPQTINPLKPLNLKPSNL